MNKYCLWEALLIPLVKLNNRKRQSSEKFVPFPVIDLLSFHSCPGDKMHFTGQTSMSAFIFPKYEKCSLFRILLLKHLLQHPSATNTHTHTHTHTHIHTHTYKFKTKKRFEILRLKCWNSLYDKTFFVVVVFFFALLFAINELFLGTKLPGVMLKIE